MGRPNSSARDWGAAARTSTKLWCTLCTTVARGTRSSLTDCDVLLTAAAGPTYSSTVRAQRCVRETADSTGGVTAGKALQTIRTRDGTTRRIAHRYSQCGCQHDRRAGPPPSYCREDRWDWTRCDASASPRAAREDESQSEDARADDHAPGYRSAISPPQGPGPGSSTMLRRCTPSASPRTPRNAQDPLCASPRRHRPGGQETALHRKRRHVARSRDRGAYDAVTKVSRPRRRRSTGGHTYRRRGDQTAWTSTTTIHARRDTRPWLLGKS